LFQVPLARHLAGAGTYEAPAVFRLDKIDQLETEIFGPVLHVVRFAAGDLDAMVDAINKTGHGLTLGIHRRVETRVMRIALRARAGNIYVNRNQIGAVVGSQPFGGRGLSGTGPKAGGPQYLQRFTQPTDAHGHDTPAEALPSVLPGVTGERNVYTLKPRGPFLCLGGGDKSADTMRRQCVTALAAGNDVVLSDGESVRAVKASLADGNVKLLSGDAIALATMDGLNGVAFDGGGAARDAPATNGAGGLARGPPGAGARRRRGAALPGGKAGKHRHHRGGRQCDATGRGRLSNSPVKSPSLRSVYFLPNKL
jgi:RHH-type proline utilization regulon transcriptional repressor/proline dehydrogenase/delta 1-pyrroline-5-carboxylate dehydrogenase